MQEHDRTRSDGGQHRVHNRINARARPISWIHRPMHHAKSGHRCCRKHFFSPPSVRCSHVPQRRLRAGRTNDVAGSQYFTLHLGQFATGQVRMCHRVISDLMPVCDHSPYEVRLLRCVGANDEEGGLDPTFCQQVQDIWCTKWIWAVIKRQIDAATSVGVSVLATHRAQVIGMLHSSGPFRSIIVPVGHSPIDRTIGSTNTRASSMRVVGKFRYTSGWVDRTRMPERSLASPCRPSILVICFSSAGRTVPKPNGTPSSCRTGYITRIEWVIPSPSRSGRTAYNPNSPTSRSTSPTLMNRRSRPI
ncbi:hypothetical protein ACVWYQ_003284 [Bradyrhizobium sp. USDA 3397]